MYKIVHLVPYDGIGGVETAAKTMMHVYDGNIDFEVKYIFDSKNKSRKQIIKSTYNPIKLLSAALGFRKNTLDVLIVSLWRSQIVGLLVKLFKPRTKLVTFLHSAKDAHLLDSIFCRVSLLFSSQIWADSEATSKGRLSSSNQRRCLIISFVTKSIDALPVKTVEPVFMFLGRINSTKGLDRSIMIFAEILKKYATARFFVLGPDDGSLNEIKKLCRTIGLLESVIFKGQVTFDEIICYACQASFYLQTSVLEGFAMSVVESMQLGLVPVVTPVGEIGFYCINGKNAVIVDSDKQAAEDVLSLLASNDHYQSLRTMAIATWKDHVLYQDSVLNACKDIVESESIMHKISV